MDLSHWAQIDLGNFTIIDLIAATTNAFNGALLARQPSHYRRFTDHRDPAHRDLRRDRRRRLARRPAQRHPVGAHEPALPDPVRGRGFLALRISGQLDAARSARLFDFMSAFSLPWYAAIGTNKALEPGCPTSPAS